MSTRKRKAEDNLPHPGSEDAFPQSPLERIVQTPRTTKRIRTNLSGRPLPLPRLLETLSVDEMRGLVQNLCERHPDIAQEITSAAPRPSVQSALNVLDTYRSTLQESFPYGDRHTSDYAYNRVRPALLNLLDALKDYTPHFLPPQEMQASTSLSYLDGATTLVHDLPTWDSYQHNRHKEEAYEEVAKAWALVIREAAKKGGSIQIQYGGWDQKLAKHNELAGGKLSEAVQEMRSSLGWNGDGASSNPTTPQQGMSIRDELFNGTYGTNQPVQVGPWRY